MLYWRLNGDTRCIELLEGDGDVEADKWVYEVDLDRCTTPAQTLDWIVQVGKKGFVSHELVGQLVRLLNECLDLQRTQCGCGTDLTTKRRRP